MIVMPIFAYVHNILRSAVAYNGNFTDADPDKTLEEISDQFGTLNLQIAEKSKKKRDSDGVISKLQQKILEKDRNIKELQFQLEQEERRTYKAKQKAAAALQEKEHALNEKDKFEDKFFYVMKADTDAQTNQINLIESQLTSALSKGNSSSDVNIAIANMILMFSASFQNPSELLQKYIGNGFTTVNLLIRESFTVKHLKISKDFAIDYLVNSRIPWLSVGSGDCSLEGTLISMMPRPKYPKIVISPTTRVSLAAENLFPEIHKYIKSEIDAENLHNFSRYNLPDNSAILFNCPWAREKCMTPKLLQNFMSSAARIQRTGCYLFLGITENKYYFDEYKLNDLFEIIHGVYTLDLIDVGFMGKVKFGYTHHSDSGKVLYGIIEKHVMLCFKRC